MNRHEVDVQAVQVTPRHLAGAGDPRHVTAPLIALRWTATTTAGAPDLYMRSPDGRHELRLTPDADRPWWTLQTFNPPHGQPSWHAMFGARTPVEILAGLTDALTAPPPRGAPDPWEPLSRAGWVFKTDQQNATARSPDGIAEVELFQQGQYQHWRITAEHTFVGAHHEVWSARFSGSTPLHLVAAVTVALADPAPLLRHPAALPVHSRHLMHTTTSDLQPQTQLEHRIQAARRAAALLGAVKDTTPVPRAAVTTAPQGRTR